MANIKSLDASSDKWKRRAAVASIDYQNGIENPKKDWSTATLEAEDNYKQGVIAAANRGAFGKGVKKAGSQKWKTNASAKGPARYAEGVALAEGEWQKGYSPYHTAIANLKLPQKGPKGDPKNLARVAAVVNVQRAVKEKQN